MKRIVKKTAAFLLGVLLLAPCLEAQNRTTGNRNGSRSEQVSHGRSGNESHRKQPAARPASGRPSSGRPGSSRPGNSNNSGTVNHRPGSNGNHNQGVSNRPGSNGNHNQGVSNRPGNNGNHNWNQGNRPNRPTTGVRPGQEMRPPHNNAHRPGNGHNYRPPYVHRPPVHVHRPAPRPWHRPVPPPAWHPRPGAPVIASIFGINFGTTLNISLNFLLGHGYTVSSYGSNAVYLSDVNQYNYYWPEATMYYGNNGLERTEFFYSTGYPDTVRYRNLYNNLTAIYGSPVDVTNVSSSLSATWFAPNQGYIRLQYVPQYSGGQLRFFTSITTGL